MGGHGTALHRSSAPVLQSSHTAREPESVSSGTAASASGLVPLEAGAAEFGSKSPIRPPSWQPTMVT